MINEKREGKMKYIAYTERYETDTADTGGAYLIADLQNFVMVKITDTFTNTMMYQVDSGSNEYTVIDKGI